MKQVVILIATLILSIGTVTLCEAASITTNIEGNVVCPGEELILTCISVGTAQRWNVIKVNSDSTEQVFIGGDQPGIISTLNSFTFTLTSTEYSNFVSTLSTVVTNDMNNTEVVCTGLSSPAAATIIIRIAGEPSPPQNPRSRIVEHHSNYSTVVVMWEPASNDLRVDFYQYQLIDSLTEVRASNTTNTTAILSDVPYNVNISFVISAYNCERESEQATLYIDVEPMNSITDFEQVASYTLSSTVTTPEVSTNAVITPATERENKLLISTTVACTCTVIFVLILVCVIVAVVLVKQLRRKRLDLPQDLYTEIENVNPIYETVDNKALSCAEYNDMSYVDMCGGCAPDPVYDEAKIDLEAAEETPVTVDEKHKETKCCNLANNGIHYQNVRSTAQ